MVVKFIVGQMVKTEMGCICKGPLIAVAFSLSFCPQSQILLELIPFAFCVALARALTEGGIYRFDKGME